VFFSSGAGPGFRRLYVVVSEVVVPFCPDLDLNRVVLFFRLLQLNYKTVGPLIARQTIEEEDLGRGDNRAESRHRRSLTVAMSFFAPSWASAAPHARTHRSDLRPELGSHHRERFRRLCPGGDPVREAG
jgi:hypothetical protein